MASERPSLFRPRLLTPNHRVLVILGRDLPSWATFGIVAKRSSRGDGQ